MHRGRPTLDTERATQLLAEGRSVYEVAAACGVTTQAIYYALKVGRVQRPEPAEAVA